MANEEHFQRLTQGVSGWNAWRHEHPKETIDLIGAPLFQAELSGANLSGARLFRANLSHAWLIKANLSGANLSEANLQEANLSGANLSEANLQQANLLGADLRQAHLQEAGLFGADLRQAKLSGVDLSGVNLIRADLSMADLFQADLSGVKLIGADLWSADLRRANLSGASLSEANLIEANLNGATLTDACLWESQRAGWSIQGIICEAAYWDKDRKERARYKPGEFERLYADKTKIVLHYEGGIKPIEIMTLPAVIRQIEEAHAGCVLRLHSVQDAPSGATVTLVVDDVGLGNAASLAEQLQEMAEQLQAVQRYALEQADMRRQIEHTLRFVSNEFFPKLLERAMEQSGDQYHIGSVGRDFSGSVRGNAHVNIGSTVTYTTNDLAAIEARISDIYTHRAELSLTAPQLMEFEAQLRAIQEQLAAQTPNHSLLREGLHTVRHILEAGAAHVLVGHWQEVLHTLQSLTRG